MDAVSEMTRRFVEETHNNPKQVIKYLDPVSNIFYSSAFVAVVGIGYFRRSLTNRFICITGSFSLLGTIFLYSINKFVAKVQEGKHCDICSKNLIVQLIREEKIPAIKSFLAQGLDLNQYDRDGLTLFHLACTTKNEEIIKLFLGNGADIKMKVSKGPNKGFTALHFAAQGASLEVVKLLVERGAGISAKDDLGYDSIGTAKNSNNKHIVEFLEAKEKGDVPPEKEKKRDLKQDTIKDPLSESVATILSKIISPAKPGEQLKQESLPTHIFIPPPRLEAAILFDLAKEGKLDDLKAQIELGRVDLNRVHKENKDYTLLHYAAAFGHLEMCKFLKEKGANLNKEELNGYAPFELALYNGRDEVAECIKPKDSNRKPKTAFVWDLLSTYSIDHCLELGADILGLGKEGRISLHYCASKPEKLEVLITRMKERNLDIGFWINQGDNYENTPLHMVESIESIGVLIKNGAKFDLENNTKQTPLQKAFFDKRLNIVKEMIHCGADVKSLENDQDHPLIHRLVEMMFTTYNHQKQQDGMNFFRYLIETGKYSINQQDVQGQTVLHLAAAKDTTNNRFVLIGILKLNPDETIKNKMGKTPLKIANSSNPTNKSVLGTSINFREINFPEYFS